MTAALPDAKDFALVLCPPWEVRMPPIWPAILAGALRAEGFEGTCHDLNNLVYRGVPPAARVLWDHNRIDTWLRAEAFEAEVWAQIGPQMEAQVAAILDPEPLVVGMTVTVSNARCCIRLAERIKQACPQTTIVFGGPGTYYLHEEDGERFPGSLYDPFARRYIDRNDVVDLYVRGEADETLPRLLRQLRAGLDPLDLPGVYARRGGHWVYPHAPQPPPDLARLAAPDYSDLDVASFESRTLAMLSSRGCQRRCAFCSDCQMQGKHRRLSADRVFEQMRGWHQTYGTRTFVMTDLMLNGSPAALERLSDRLIAADLGLEWAGQAIVRPEMDEALLRKMARAGCRELSVGVESLSQPVIDLMNKRFELPTAIMMMNAAQAAGIGVAINLIVGFPGESPEMFQQTVETLRRARPAISRVQSVNLCNLSAGSRIANDPRAFGIDTNVDEHWHRWRGPEANTYEVRLKHARELVEVLAELALDVDEINTYERGAEELSVPRLLISHIHAVVGGEIRTEVDPGAPLTLCVGYRAFEVVEQPVIRIQIFNDQNPAGDNVFVLGTNTARCGVELGRIAPGPGEIKLHFSSLNLAPGLYLTTVGLWPDADAAQPYDVRHGGLITEVRGSHDPTGACVLLPARIGVEQVVVEALARATPAQAAGAVLHGPLALEDAAGAALGVARSGDPLTIRCNGQSDDDATAVVTVELRIPQGVAARHLEGVALPAGGWCLTVHLPSLTLLGGEYLLALELMDPASGDPLARIERQLVVTSEQAAGAGLSFSPSRWIVDRPPPL